MPLKYIVPAGEISTLPSEVQNLYVKEEGSDKFILQVEGAVPVSKLSEFRDNNIELQKRLEVFKGVDPEKYKQLLELQDKVDTKALVDASGIDSAVQARTQKMTEEHAKRVEELAAKLQEKTQDLDRLVVTNALSAAALQGGVHASALPDAMYRGSGVFKNVDGAAVALDKNGNIIYGADGEKPLTPLEWVKTSLKTEAAHLFMSSTGGGAAGGFAGGKGQTQGMTPAQRIADALAAK